MKRCTKCLKFCALSDFHKTTRTKSGIRGDCKHCAALYRASTKDEKSLYYKERWKNSSKDKKALANERSRLSYHKHKERRFGIVFSKISNMTEEELKKARRRYKPSPQQKLASNLRLRLRLALKKKGTPQKGLLGKYLGCSFGELTEYLQSQFQPGMSWENRQAWHVDHIIPLSWGDLHDPEFLKVVLHFTNLRPLWAADNIRKSNLIGAGVNP